MSFSMKWDPVYGNVSPEFLERKSYGGAIGDIGSALNAVANDFRQDQTNSALMNIAQLATNKDALAERPNVLAQFDQMGKAIDQKAVLEALLSKTDALGNQDAKNLATGLKLDQITDNDVVAQRAAASGLGNQYLDPITQAMAGNTATKLAAEQQAFDNKIKETTTASNVALNNSQIKQNDVSIADVIAKNPDKEIIKREFDADGNEIIIKQTTAGTGSVLGAITGAKGQAVKPANLNKEQQANMDTTWKALKSNGVSDTAATFLLGEIGREGSFANANIFGDHKDPKAGRTNSGIISWSDPGRRKAFLSDMKQAGHLNPNGTMKQTPEALSAQVNFMLKEMKTSYPDAYKALQRNDLTDEEADKLFGGNYIGWSRKDPAFAAEGYQNRASFAQAASSRYSSGGGGGTQAVTATNADTGKAVKVQPGVGFEGESVITARSKFKAFQETQNAKDVISNGMRSTVAEDQKYNEFLTSKGYTGTFMNNRWGDNSQIYNAMTGLTNKALWGTLNNKERMEVLEHVSSQNKAKSGFFGDNISYQSMINEARNYMSTKRKEAAAAQKQASFSEYDKLAAEVFAANKANYPNITMDMARKVVDPQLFKEYDRVRKAQSKKETLSTSNKKK